MTMMLLIKIMLAVLATFFALILLILILPINLELCYSGKEFDFKIKILFFRVDSLVKHFSKRKTKDNPKEKPEKDKNGKKLQSIKSTSKYLKAFLASSGKIMKIIIKSLNIKRLNVKVCVGSEEASKTATNYGVVCAAVYPAFSAFMSCNEPKHYDISVEPDFISDKINFFIDLKLKTRIISLLLIAIKLLKIIKNKLK